jgi:hypothetical protein
VSQKEYVKEIEEQLKVSERSLFYARTVVELGAADSGEPNGSQAGTERRSAKRPESSKAVSPGSMRSPCGAGREPRSSSRTG